VQPRDIEIMAAEGLNMALQAASHVPALSSTITVMDTSGKVINTVCLDWDFPYSIYMHHPSIVACLPLG